MERYLQLCARHNMYVADCTTPANFFHLLRRQMKTPSVNHLWCLPKSLLRDPRCVSTVEELATGSFQETIDDTTVNKADVKTLVFCTGKFYLTLPLREKIMVVKMLQLLESNNYSLYQ
jgi:2-oxoglutarate dehydrogenase E1 component